MVSTRLFWVPDFVHAPGWGGARVPGGVPRREAAAGRGAEQDQHRHDAPVLAA